MAGFFSGVPERIPFGGLDSDDPYSFKVYDADRLVRGVRMGDHLRIAVCLWHSFNWPGSDVFGVGTFDRPWLSGTGDPMAAAHQRLEGSSDVHLEHPHQRAAGQNQHRCSPRFRQRFLLVVGAAFLLGLVLPIVSHLGIAPSEAVGARLSYLYLANIVGSAAAVRDEARNNVKRIVTGLRMAG